MGLVPVGYDEVVRVLAASNLDREGMGYVQRMSISCVTACNEDASILDGGPKEYDVAVRAYVCARGCLEHTAGRRLGLGSFGGSHKDAPLCASTCRRSGGSDGASRPLVVVPVGLGGKLARTNVRFRCGDKWLGPLE